MFTIAPEFWQVKDAQGKWAKVHICLNGVPVDTMWTAEEFLSRPEPSHRRRVGYAEFLANPCGVNTDDGHIGPNGCVSVMVRGLDMEAAA